MMASRVTPPFEEEGVELEGIAGIVGLVVSIHGYFDRNWASLHLTEAALMVPIMVKWEN